ncbi:IS110 family transposase [Microbacterium pseudoresistens]|uniref:Transposase n=1 Tax=Microbacterium pseudoresistens TaxID=640634 RepID=A0A7Y9EVE5_9MICO|nr:IS110 family transposase [Microbacterium pseudoresistens]NYD54674.1 transposase [Microbacterium pseudoresistens]
MLVVGIDVHKKSHTAVAVDGVGKKVGEVVVAATDSGHRQLLGWARRRFGRLPDRWAVEDCRHLTGRLERALLSAGQVVVRVPPKLMAGARRSVRSPGKSDPIDALSVARASLTEPDLPAARLDEPTRELKLLIERREQLVAERTREVNRIRWHLHALDPAQDPASSAFNTATTRARLHHWLDMREGIDADLARMVLNHIDRLCDLIRELTSRIERLTLEQAPPELLALPGCGVLTAAKILAETAGATRFRSEACFAMNAGVAPIPVWSGNTAGRVRLNRGGNRQLNAAMHRIAITQVRLGGLGRAYYDHRRANGDTSTEAYRALKRRLARVVFNILTRHEQASATCIPQAA